VMRHRREGHLEYAIHDVYFEGANRVSGYTEQARSPRFATTEELKAWIVATLKDESGFVVCGDLGYEHSHTDLELWLVHIDDPPIDWEDC